MTIFYRLQKTAAINVIRGYIIKPSLLHFRMVEERSFEKKNLKC